MNEEVRKHLFIIEKRLLQSDIKRFKIGKTSNAQERFNSGDYDDFLFASVIATSENTAMIDQAEKDLIYYFRNHQILREKCDNKQEGGGPDGATAVYIVAQKQYEGQEMRAGVFTDEFPQQYEVPDFWESYAFKEPLLEDFKAIIL